MTTKEPRTPLEVCQRWQAELHCDMMNAQKNRGIMIPREAAAAHMAVVCLMEEIAALPTGWQPIAIAPQTDELVLLWAAARDDLRGFVTIGAYHPDVGWCVDELREVTHWQPLPAPPETAP